jgi:2-polyprenyl-6-methoxyphenol hydroxylase-like FAD-dependent oxidoreductase
VTSPIRRHDVVVIGAGPSGLMAALCLIKAGVDVVVVDSKSGPTRESRALALQARSMELYDQLGIIDRVLAEGDRAPRIVPGVGRRTFPEIHFGEAGRTLTPFPGISVLEQSRNEHILADAFRHAGGTVFWNNRVETVDLQDGTSPPVRLEMSGPDGVQSLVSRWCIAADGASSTIRTLLGIPFEGTTNPHRFFVADAVGVRGLVGNAVNMRFGPRDFLLTFPMGGVSHHRLLGVIDESAAPETMESRVRERIADAFGVEYERSRWFSDYRVHHRLAARFRLGPVFLVGDAAHVHSPVGAQGMNTGLQDAHNLACKLIDVLQRGAAEGVLDQYEAERRPVARRLVKVTDAAFARMTSNGAIATFARTRLAAAIAPVAVRIVPRLVGMGRLFGYLSQIRIRYPLRTGRHGDPVVGRRLPWTGNNYASLRSFSWQVHSYGASGGDLIAAGLNIDGHVFPPDAYGRLSATMLYLVRPDGFVASAGTWADAPVLFGRVLAAHGLAPSST